MNSNFSFARFCLQTTTTGSTDRQKDLVTIVGLHEDPIATLLRKTVQLLFHALLGADEDYLVNVVHDADLCPNDGAIRKYMSIERTQTWAFDSHQGCCYMRR